MDRRRVRIVPTSRAGVSAKAQAARRRTTVREGRQESPLHSRACISLARSSSDDYNALSNAGDCLMRSQRRDDWTSLSHKQRKAFTLDLIRIYGNLCCLCGLRIKRGEESCEHLIPRSKGGRTTIENCRPAHIRCNSAKRDREYKGPSSVIYDATARLFTG